jgi:hypothetical protein
VPGRARSWLGSSRPSPPPSSVKGTSRARPRQRLRRASGSDTRCRQRHWCPNGTQWVAGSVSTTCQVSRTTTTYVVVVLCAHLVFAVSCSARILPCVAVVLRPHLVFACCARIVSLRRGRVVRASCLCVVVVLCPHRVFQSRSCCARIVSLRRGRVVPGSCLNVAVVLCADRVFASRSCCARILSLGRGRVVLASCLCLVVALWSCCARILSLRRGRVVRASCLCVAVRAVRIFGYTSSRLVARPDPSSRISMAAGQKHHHQRKSKRSSRVLPRPLVPCLTTPLQPR